MGQQWKSRPHSKGGPRANTSADKEIGLRIRAIRTDREMSQNELAERLGVSFQQVQKYEKGVNRVTLSRSILIARVLKTTPHELCGWDGSIGEANFNEDAYRLSKKMLRLPQRTILAMIRLSDSIKTDKE
jgi:transcriptional regulator with XRE-family HTH domain